jgi:hypothetical protein
MVGLTASEIDAFAHRARPPGNARRRGARDCTLFFIGLPLACALWATSVGIGPARVLGFQAGLAYVGTQMLAAFCGNGLTARAAARILRGFALPLWGVLLVGYAVSWLPLYTFYLYHFAWFSQIFPEIVAPMNRPPTGFTTQYLVHAARYSLPFIPMWLTAVYGYRFLTGVDFFAAGDSSRLPHAVPACSAAQPAAPEPAALTRDAGDPPRFLTASRLPRGAVALAIKAEEHYIRIWSPSGTDIIRYRFSDAVRELADRNGCQVHRSWWINWDAVRNCRHRGRALELVLDNGLEVPVSLAYKADAQRRLAERRPPA